jgi:Lipase (class 3)
VRSILHYSSVALLFAYTSKLKSLTLSYYRIWLLTPCSQRVEASLGAIAKLSKSNPTPLVHTGFRKAYSSIRDSLIDVITTATSSGSSTPEQWHIYATGHSLGGTALQYACT